MSHDLSEEELLQGWEVISKGNPVKESSEESSDEEGFVDVKSEKQHEIDKQLDMQKLMALLMAAASEPEPELSDEDELNLQWLQTTFNSKFQTPITREDMEHLAQQHGFLDDVLTDLRKGKYPKKRYNQIIPRIETIIREFRGESEPEPELSKKAKKNLRWLQTTLESKFQTRITREDMEHLAQHGFLEDVLTDLRKGAGIKFIGDEFTETLTNIETIIKEFRKKKDEDGVGVGFLGGSQSKRKTRKRKASKRKASKRKASKRKTSKRKVSKRKASKRKTHKRRKASKRKVSKRK